LTAIPFGLEVRMARCVDPEKVRAWRRLMARFETSGLSVAGFCRREGVSLASFYYWRKRLAQVGWLAPGPYPADGGAGRHIGANARGARGPRLVAMRREDAVGACAAERTQEGATPRAAQRATAAQFRPVRLVASAGVVVRRSPERGGRASPAHARTLASAATGCGARLRWSDPSPRRGRHKPAQGNALGAKAPPTWHQP
jgi:hypothetical protein